MFNREVDILGVFRYRNTYPLCLDMLSSGRINVKPLITHRYGFNQKDVVDAFETSAKGGSAIKVMFNLWEGSRFRASLFLCSLYSLFCSLQVTMTVGSLFSELSIWLWKGSENTLVCYIYFAHITYMYVPMSITDVNTIRSAKNVILPDCTTMCIFSFSFPLLRSVH